VTTCHGTDYRSKYQFCGNVIKDDENLIEFVHEYKELYDMTENATIMCINNCLTNAEKVLKR
jgi:hypothetical protein